MFVARNWRLRPIKAVIYRKGIEVNKMKVGPVKLAEQLASVSRVCRVMDYSRDSFYGDYEVVQYKWRTAHHEETAVGPYIIRYIKL